MDVGRGGWSPLSLPGAEEGRARTMPKHGWFEVAGGATGADVRYNFEQGNYCGEINPYFQLSNSIVPIRDLWFARYLFPDSDSLWTNRVAACADPGRTLPSRGAVPRRCR